MKKAIKVVLIILLIAGIAAGGFFLAKDIYEQKYEIQMKEEKDRIFQEGIALTQETIESGLKDMGVLCTAEYYFEHVESYKGQLYTKGGHKIPLTSSSFIYSYEGRIIAGVDFASVKVDVDHDKKTVTVTLPQAEIISSEVDEDSFKLYDEKNNIFNKLSVEDFAVSFADMIKYEEEKAEKDGLLDRARDNAEMLVKNFISSGLMPEGYRLVVK